ncbi:putative reverse transcriptase domain-containing protein [Tanacetum coccineum]
MSSPNHLTSGIEDAFSSNFPDFILASPDYVPASPGNTYSSSSNSFGIIPIASPTLSLFHDDPYMKIGESSRKTSLERHEEQIKEILNHLYELSLDRIEYIEDKIEGLGKGQVIIQQDFDNIEAELQEARAQISKLQKKLMGNNHKISLAHFRITDLEHIINDIQIRHQEDKETPAITQAAIKKLVADSVIAALEVQAATMASISNPNKNTGPTGTPVAKIGNNKEFIRCQAFYFSGNKAHSGVSIKRQEAVKAYAATPTKNSRADKSFISISLASMLNIPPITIDTFYHIEMADENLVSTNTVIQGATLTLLNQPFKIDLMPIKLDRFDVIFGMDWLSKFHARIIYDEKIVHIPIDGET